MLSLDYFYDSADLPKRIETDEEFEHFSATMEGLSRTQSAGTAGPEDQALHSLLSTLIKEYDDRIALSEEHVRRLAEFFRASTDLFL